MNTHPAGYALVLAGGGGKGAYQIGAWRALKEERIGFQAIAGASVGALNAGLMAMNEFNLAEDLWHTVSFEKIVNVPRQFIRDGNLDLDIRNIRAFSRHVIKTRGLDTLPLYRMIRSYLKEERIRASGIDLGLISFDLSSLKPREVYLHHIPDGHLARYMLASASFPLFKTVEIEGKRFTDGGIFNNIPYQMVKSRGYKQIIVMDISGMGRNKTPDISGTTTMYIRNSINMGWDLDFSPDRIRQNMHLGYLDTRKVLGKNSGMHYFIVPDKRRLHEIEVRLARESNKARITHLLDNMNIPGKSYIDRLEQVLPQEYRHTDSLGLAYLECAAKSLDIPRVHEYSTREFQEAIETEYKKLKNMTYRPPDRDFGRFFKQLRSQIHLLSEDRDLFNLSAAEYARIGSMIFGRDPNRHRLKALYAFFPEILAARILALIQEP